MVERHNAMSTIMLKNVKLSYQNVRLALATPEMCQYRSLSINPIYYIDIFIINKQEVAMLSFL